MMPSLTKEINKQLNELVASLKAGKQPNNTESESMRVLTPPTA
jgi:hypothetical protein